MTIQQALAKAKKLLADNYVVEPPVDVAEIAANNGLDVRVAEFPAEYQGVSGFINLEDGRPAVYVNADDPPHRQKFTIAHELGHWLLHEDEIRTNPKKAILFRIAIGETNSDPLEKQANAFAAELLVPMELFAKVKDKPVKDLVDMFDVSSDVIGYRKKAAEHVAAARTTDR